MWKFARFLLVVCTIFFCQVDELNKIVIYQRGMEKRLRQKHDALTALFKVVMVVLSYHRDPPVCAGRK